MQVYCTSKKHNTQHQKAKMDKLKLEIPQEYWRKSKFTFRKLKSSSTNRARVFKRKYISERGNFSFNMPRSKTLTQKNIFCSVVLDFKAETFSLHLYKYAKRYSMTLNPPGHDIYLRVIWI